MDKIIVNKLDNIKGHIKGKMKKTKKLNNPCLFFLGIGFWFWQHFFMSHFVIAQEVTEDEKSKYLGIYYANTFFGNIHRNPSRYSDSLTTIACGHPLKIYQDKEAIEGWRKVFIGESKGFVLVEILSEKKPVCFQEQYPKFFDGLGLDLSDMYYWGRLFDQAITGVTKAP